MPCMDQLQAQAWPLAQRQQTSFRSIRMPCMDIAVDTMVDTTDIPTGHTDTTERGLLTLSQRPSLSLQLMLTTSDIMVLDMLDTTETDTDTPSPAHYGVPVPDTTGDRCHAF